MNKLQKRIITAGASTLLFLQSTLPVFAATTIEISGNGSESNNNGNVQITNSTTVVQSNNANITNDVNAHADTGDNEANRNTGGDVSVDTGNAGVNVSVENTANTNVANVDNCGGCTGSPDANILINGNGSDSDNTVKAGLTNNTFVSQDNKADIDNHVNADADSGDNEANRNTGGNVEVNTGSAQSNVDVSNNANANSAQINGGSGSSSLSATIKGNGESSDNKIKLGLTGSVTLVQDNRAHVMNFVKAEAETGDNEANRNTGGDVSIETGDATIGSGVRIANNLNSNSAVIGGNGAGVSIDARILENGSESDNKINLDLDQALLVLQENNADVKNFVKAEAETGDNEAEENTGGEVSIETGDAYVKVAIDNMINFNWADLDCGCLFSSVLAKIAGNAEDTDNVIKAVLGNVVTVAQDNCGQTQLGADATGGRPNCGGRRCELENKVDAEGETGDNEVERNTSGDGVVDPSVDTGDAEIEIDIENRGNSNVYGDAPQAGFPLPFPDGFWFNLNISLDWQDLMDWFMAQA